MKRSRNLQKPGSYSIRAVDRAIQILDCFSFHQKEHTLGELVELTRLSKSTVFRILQTLERHRLIACDPSSNRYSLGMKLFEWGGIVFSSLSLRKAASRFLDRLETEVHHAVLLGILEEGKLVYIDKREGNDPIKLTSEIGTKRPPYFGMLGKTLMAFKSEEEVGDLLDRHPLEKVAPQSITDPKKFRRSLREIREKGYTYENGEAVEGVIGIAAPVRNYGRKVVAAVGTAFSAFSTDDQKVEAVIRRVTETADEISEALGFIEFSKESGRREVKIRPEGKESKGRDLKQASLKL